LSLERCCSAGEGILAVRREADDFSLAHRLLKAVLERLKKDAAEREAAKDFEIKQSKELPQSMRVIPSREGSADSNAAE